MPNRFSRALLFRLRNDISIEFVLTRLLRIPSKLSDGYVRFLCPICSEFNSSINPKANLARCFRCNKNFNPIDLVMAEKGLPFRDAVNLLLPLLPDHTDTAPQPPSHDPRPSQPPPPPNAREPHRLSGKMPSSS